MGECAEMMLDGTCCSSCGEYLGRDDGFPVQCAGCDPGDNETLRYAPARVGLDGAWLRVAQVLQDHGGTATRARIQDVVAGPARNARKRVNKHLQGMLAAHLVDQGEGDIWALTRKGRKQLGEA